VLTGNHTRLPLLTLYSLRSNLLRTPALTLLTVIALAASVALAVAAEISTRSLEREIEETADALSGAAELEVRAGGPGVPERLLEQVRALPGVESATPVIDWVTALVDGETVGHPLHVLAVDFTSDREIRSYSVTNGTIRIHDPLRLLSQINSIIITSDLARRAGLELGGRFRVRGPAGPVELVVQGLLEPGGVADAYNGQIAAMDLYAVQELLGRPGFFDRIDVAASRRVDLDALTRRLRSAASGFASVGRSRMRNEASESVYAAVRLCLWLASGLALLVSGLLSYGALSLSVDRRARELALLQVAGLEPRRVRRIIWTDALLMGTAGVVIGFVAGVGLSGGLFHAIGEFTVLTQHTTAAPVRPGAGTVGVALVVGLALSILGSFEPALRATARKPVELLRGSERSRASTLAQVTVAAVLASVCVGVGFAQGVLWLPSALKVAGLLLAGLVAIFVLALPLFRLVARCRPGVQRLLPSVGGFVGWSTFIRPVHSAFAVVGVGAALATGVATLVTIESVDSTFRTMMANRYPGALLVDAAQTRSPRVLPPDLVREIRGLPEVAALSESYGFPTMYRGRQVEVFGRTTEVVSARGTLPYLEPSQQEVARALMQGEIAVSLAFAEAFDVEIGDLIALDSPLGPQRFVVAGLSWDLAGPAGSIEMDIGTMDAAWSRPGAGRLVVWPASSKDDAERAIREVSGAWGGVFVYDAKRLEDAMTEFYARFKDFFYAILGVGALLAGLATQSLLMGIVLERRRDFELLRTVGATRAEILLLMVADGAVVGLLGTLGGLTLGLLVALPLRELIWRQIGWFLLPSVGWYPVLACSAAVFAGCCFAAALPGWATARARPKGVALEE
jgi:putative ABC transport system permease protein